MLYKSFWKLGAAFISGFKLIVFALGVYYVLLPAFCSILIYLYDSLSFVYALCDNYMSRLEVFGNVSELVNKIQINQRVSSFLYKQGYFHIWNGLTYDVYSSRMLWNVCVTFWYDWAVPYLFDTKYAWRLEFVMLPFSEPYAFYILPYWQNYAHLYYQLGCGYNQFFDAGDGIYAFPSVNRYVKGMSGSYLLVEYRYAWILTLYHLIKPAVVFGGVPQLFDMLDDFSKYTINLCLNVPGILQFKLLYFVVVVWVLNRFIFNKSFFNDYVLVSVPFFLFYTRDAVIKFLVVLFVCFFLLCGVIFLAVFFIFKFWIGSILLYALSILCLLVFLFCGLQRKAAFTHYYNWISQLNVNKYVLTRDEFVNNMVIVGVNFIFKKITKGFKWWLREWVKELARDRHHDRVINFWYKIYRDFEVFINRKTYANKNIEPFYGPLNLYRYYLFLLALWSFLLTHVVLINTSGVFNTKFVGVVDNVDLQYVIPGERNQICYSTCLPVVYSEEFVPVSLKVSRGGVWVRSTYREVSPLFYFRNKDLLRYWNLTDFDKTVLWKPNFTYIIFNLDRHYVRNGVFEPNWSQLYKRVRVLYSVPFDDRVISSLITFYEYYSLLISIYTMPVFRHWNWLTGAFWFNRYIVRVTRNNFEVFFNFVIKRFISMFKVLLLLYYNYSAEITDLRKFPHGLPYSNLASIFNLSAYNYLNVNNRSIEVYQHDKMIVANKCTKIKRVFRISDFGIVIFGGLSIKLVVYIFVLLSMKVAHVLFRTYERFIVDYLLYYLLSFLYKIWFFSKIFDIIDYNMNTPFVDIRFSPENKIVHLTNPPFLRERLVCTRYFSYGRRTWRQAVRGKSLFFHKQPNAFDWNFYL